jgi:hypothetical protein
MTRRLWTIAAIAVFSAVPAVRAYAAQAAVPEATYVNENPATLNLRELDGKVVGLGGEPMPRAQVALFSENGHALLGTVVSDRQGKFRFDKIEKGLYRVVARVEGLCPANVPVKVGSSLLAKRHLIITMRPKDLDTCSYGVAK